MYNPAAYRDPAAMYQATAVTTSGPADRVILLYQGAIRHGAQHLVALGRNDLEAASRASLRAQAIVEALDLSLDMSAGSVAVNLHQLYQFVLDRLVEGNISKTARPTDEALTVLRDLLEAWRGIAKVTPAPARLTVVADRSPVGAGR